MCDLGSSDYLWETPKKPKLKEYKRLYTQVGERGPEEHLVYWAVTMLRCASTGQAKQGIGSLMGRWVGRKRRHFKEGPLTDVMCAPEVGPSAAGWVLASTAATWWQLT